MSAPSNPHQELTAKQPNPLALIFHLGKTFRLTGALMKDGRVSIFRKIFFVGAILAMIVLLFSGDLAVELFANVIPFIGPAIGLPADAAFDWLAIAVLALNLLRVFPISIVGEHYNRIFKGQPPQQQMLSN